MIYLIIFGEFSKYEHELDFKFVCHGNVGKSNYTLLEAQDALNEELDSILTRPYFKSTELVFKSDTEFTIKCKFKSRQKEILIQYKIVELGI